MVCLSALLVPTLPVNLSSRTLVFCLCGYSFVACRAVVSPWRGARAVPIPCNTIFTVSIFRWCNVVATPEAVHREGGDSPDVRRIMELAVPIALISLRLRPIKLTVRRVDGAR